MSRNAALAAGLRHIMSATVPILGATTLAVLAASGVAAAAPGSADLDRYRWKSRVVVVVAPEPGDPRLAEQRAILEEAGRGMRERDLVLVAEAGWTAAAAALRRRFGIAADAFRAILLGKDGGAKLSEARPIGLDRLFGEIDRMPMRREEMRRSGAGRPDGGR